MKVYENGEYREATDAEIEAWRKTPPPGSQLEPTVEDDAEAAEILNIILGGDGE